MYGLLAIGDDPLCQLTLLSKEWFLSVFHLQQMHLCFSLTVILGLALSFGQWVHLLIQAFCETQIHQELYL